MIVYRYCHEIRFALDFGVKLGQVVKPPEGDLFSHFLNHLGNDIERQRVWQLFQDVGGSASGSCSRILDADDDPLRHSRSGKCMERDIVQFVPFNEFKDKHMGAIARETLEEIPAQVRRPS